MLPASVDALVEGDGERLQRANVYRMHEGHRAALLPPEFELGAGQRLEFVVDPHAMQFLDFAIGARELLRQFRC